MILTKDNLLDKKKMEITITDDGNEIQTLSFMQDDEDCKGWGIDDYYIAFFDSKDTNRLIIDKHYLNEVFKVDKK